MRAISKNIGFKVTVTIALFLLFSLWSLSSAVFISFFLFLFISFILIILISSSDSERSKIFNLYFTITPLYVIYCFIAYLGYIDNNGFYFYPDQGYFYGIASDLGWKSSIIEIYRTTIISRAHIETEGAHFLFGTIAYLADTYFDGNSVLIQSLHISFIGILSNIFVFKILRVYFSEKISLRYTLYFALLSPIFYYSPWLLRDVHIAFLYVIAIYLALRSISIWNTAWFFLVFLVTAQFRLEHALVLLLFPIAHLYHNKEINSFVKSIWPVIYFIGIGVILVLLNSKFDSIVTALDSYEKYDLYTHESVEGDSGIGAKLYSLPFGIKQIALVVNSQLTPLPPWASINFSQNIYILVCASVLAMVAIYWSYVFLFVLFSFVTTKVLFQLPKSLFIFLGILILFLFLNASNINARRIMSVYPIIFIVFVFIKEGGYNIINQRTIHKRAIYTYVFLICIYIIIKYLL